MERVRSTMFLGVHVTAVYNYFSSLAKKAHQRLYFLRKLRGARVPAPVMCLFSRER